MNAEQLNVLGQVTLVVTSVLLAVGGFIGFKKAGSKISLIMGSVSAGILLVALAVGFCNKFAGYTIASIWLVAQVFTFIMRLISTKKFMPSGMILIICILAEVVVALNLYNAMKDMGLAPG